LITLVAFIAAVTVAAHFPCTTKLLLTATAATLTVTGKIFGFNTSLKRVTEFKKDENSNKYIRRSILLTAQYRLRGQKRASEVLYNATYSAEQVQERLAEIAGEPVEML